MDEGTFDRLTRLLARRLTRRTGAVAALPGLAGLAGWGMPQAEAASGTRAGQQKDRDKDNGQAKGDGNQQDRGGRREGPCGNGGREANRCRNDDDCCTRRCVNGRCKTKAAGFPCRKSSECARGLTCAGGVCTGCTPQTCPNGCCDGISCRTGNEPTACGAGGGQCAVCGNFEMCSAGTCNGGIGARCAGPDECGEGLSCAKGQCFLVCPAAACTGSWCIYAQGGLNWQDDGHWEVEPGWRDARATRMMPDRTAFLIVEDGVPRVAKIDAYTLELLGVFPDTPTGTGSVVESGSGPQQLDDPTSVAVLPDGTRVLILDNGNNRVKVLDPQDMSYIQDLPFTRPADFAQYAFSDIVYHPDSGDAVLAFSQTYGNDPGTFLVRVPLDGSTPPAAVKVVETSAIQGEEATGLAVHPDGTRLYLSTASAVVIVDLTGAVSPTGGRGSTTSDCRDGFRFLDKRALVVDADGYLWTADTNCDRMTQWDATTNPWTPKTFAYAGSNFDSPGPMVRSDGTLLHYNHASENKTLDYYCRNENVPDNTPWRSAQG